MPCDQGDRTLPLAQQESLGESTYEGLVFAGKHDAAVLMVLNKKADGGAAKDDVYHRLAKEDPRIGRELRVLHRSSAKFPDRTIAVKKDFDPALAEKLKQALIGMDKNDEGRRAPEAAGFDRHVPAGAGDFEQLDNMLR